MTKSIISKRDFLTKSAKQNALHLYQTCSVTDPKYNVRHVLAVSIIGERNYLDSGDFFSDRKYDRKVKNMYMRS